MTNASEQDNRINADIMNHTGDSDFTWASEIAGGISAMLVALPSAIAFGILIYSTIHPTLASQGAVAGLLGACVLGLVTPFIGKTKGLISAPCAPSAAVLSALASTLLLSTQQKESATSSGTILVVITLVSLFSSLLQIGFGLIGGGNLIKFIPYQVVSGYLSGVGLLISLSQLPKWLGLPRGMKLWEGLWTPAEWKGTSIVVGCTSMLAMVVAPRIHRRIPAPILALSLGGLVYFILGFFKQELWSLENNSFVIGRLAIEGSIIDSLLKPLMQLQVLSWQTIQSALPPALTLSVLLSIDTLKTCVAIDSLTRTRHNSNREIIGQGLGNFLSGLVGGVPGAGTMGATLVNLSSGGSTPRAGVIEGVSVLLAILLLGPVMAWIPVASLAGILIVISYRMFDRTMFRLAFTQAGRFDFAVIVSVIIVALTVDLIAASGVGVAFAIILFIRDQIRESVILHRTNLSETASKTQRTEQEKEVLIRHGKQAVICKLQGNLFFGTTDQFSRTIEPDLRYGKYLLLDMRKVHSLDYTAFHLLERIHTQLTERNGHLLFCGMPSQLYKQRDFERYLSQLGLVSPQNGVLIFDTYDSALEWMEEQLLHLHGIEVSKDDSPLEMGQFHLFRGFNPVELKNIEACLSCRSVAEGEVLFHCGDLGDEIFLVRKGSFKALMPLAGGKSHHIATFERGSFFGELAFLDHNRRTADVIAKTPAEVYSLSRSRFNENSIKHPEMGAQVFARLALSIAQKLRNADAELRSLEDR